PDEEAGPDQLADVRRIQQVADPAARKPEAYSPSYGRLVQADQLRGRLLVPRPDAADQLIAPRGVRHARPPPAGPPLDVAGCTPAGCSPLYPPRGCRLGAGPLGASVRRRAGRAGSRPRWSEGTCLSDGEVRADGSGGGQGWAAPECMCVKHASARQPIFR